MSPYIALYVALLAASLAVALYGAIRFQRAWCPRSGGSL